MTTSATSYFKSLQAALNYYKPYGFDNEDVMRKILDYEITIGRPLKLKGFFNSEGQFIEQI